MFFITLFTFQIKKTHIGTLQLKVTFLIDKSLFDAKFETGINFEKVSLLCAGLLFVYFMGFESRFSSNISQLHIKASKKITVPPVKIVYIVL